MQRHRCCTMQSRPQLSREVCTSEGGNVNQDKTPEEKTTRADHCSTPGQNTPFVRFCARNPSQRRTRRSKKYENVPVHAYQPIRSHVINRSIHRVKSQCGFKHTQRPRVLRLSDCVPMLPTRPLVLRTLVLPSVLRLLGEDRLPTLRVPTPLPQRAPPPGVLGARVGEAMRSSTGNSSSSIEVG
jgi:hypothetical protein